MTLKELSQLYHINREIEMDRQRIEELRAKAENTTMQFNGMPWNKSTESRVERYAADIADLTAIIAAKQEQCIHERNRLERYIAGIKDSLTRQIFTLRFVNGLSWEQTAFNMGGGYSVDCVRQKFYRYIKKTP